MHFRAGFLAVAVGLCVAQPAAAQADNVGLILRIAETLERGESAIRGPTPKVQIRPASGQPWVNVEAARTPVVPGASVRVQRYVDAQLEVRGGPQQGVLTFVPELTGRERGRVFPPNPQALPPEDGIYTVSTHSRATGELLVKIERGALVVNLRRGPLRVVVGSDTIPIRGTRLALSADETGASGYLFLDRGSIEIANHPGFEVANGALIRLQAGAHPSVVPLEPDQTEAIREAIEYHDRTLWRGLATPLWRRPVFLVPAGAILVGGGILIATQGNGNGNGNGNGGGNGRGSRTGTVVINLPF